MLMGLFVKLASGVTQLRLRYLCKVATENHKRLGLILLRTRLSLATESAFCRAQVDFQWLLRIGDICKALLS